MKFKLQSNLFDKNYFIQYSPFQLSLEKLESYDGSSMNLQEKMVKYFSCDQGTM
jgi:hypothetical protein